MSVTRPKLFTVWSSATPVSPTSVWRDSHTFLDYIDSVRENPYAGGQCSRTGVRFGRCFDGDTGDVYPDDGETLTHGPWKGWKTVHYLTSSTGAARGIQNTRHGGAWRLDSKEAEGLERVVVVVGVVARRSKVNV
eukprot:scaffold9753_cov160-Amphora_coffeaeformis.AAC.7